MVTYHAPQTPGDFTISVKVSDGELYSERKSIDIEVRKLEVNSAPELKKVEQSETNVAPNEKIVITVTATDIDNDKLTYHYEPSDGTISGTGSEVDWEAPNYYGEFTIDIWVSDGEFESNKKTINVYVIESENEEKDPWGVPGFEVSILIYSFLILFLISNYLNRKK
jgi:hypothetical protein